MIARLGCVLVVAGFVAGAAGCGSSSSASQTTTAASGARGARFQALAKCMQSKGFKLPTARRQPGSGPPPGFNLSDPKFRAALLACRTQVFGNSAPRGAGPGGGGYGGPGPPGGAGPPGGGASGQGAGNFR